MSKQQNTAITELGLCLVGWLFSVWWHL